MGTSPAQACAGPPQCLGRPSLSPTRTWAPEGPAAFLSCIPPTPQLDKAQQGCLLGRALRILLLDKAQQGCPLGRALRILLLQHTPCKARCLGAACCLAGPHSTPGAPAAFSARSPQLAGTHWCPLTPLPGNLVSPPGYGRTPPWHRSEPPLSLPSALAALSPGPMGGCVSLSARSVSF